MMSLRSGRTAALQVATGISAGVSRTSGAVGVCLYAPLLSRMSRRQETPVMQQTRLAPPSEDRRWKLVEATMRRHGYQRHSLIETLHSVQESFGYLTPEALRYVADCLRLPPSAVYGVATFYHFFTLKPKGDHVCVLCLGTACYIKGAGEIEEAVRQEFGISPGETTEDGRVSVLRARCLGACSLAPAASFDGEVAGNLTPEGVVDRIRRWTEDES